MATTLKQRIASDAAKFVNTSHFGSVATLTVGTGITATVSTINVNFNDAWMAMDPDGVELQDIGPVAMCRSVDVADASTGDTLKIDTTTYYLLHEPQDNGYGMAVVRLSTEAP